jgi:hypothetical protein
MSRRRWSFDDRTSDPPANTTVVIAPSNTAEGGLADWDGQAIGWRRPVMTRAPTGSLGCARMTTASRSRSNVAGGTSEHGDGHRD